MISEIADSRSCFPPDRRNASFIRSPTNPRTLSRVNSSSGDTCGNAHFGFPTSRCISRSWSTISPLTSCASSKASSKTDSDTNCAPASTIMIASPVPATVNSNPLSLNSSYVGLTTNSFSINPMLQAPIGSSNGISDIVNAADAPTIPSGA